MFELLHLNRFSKSKACNAYCDLLIKNLTEKKEKILKIYFKHF